MIRFDPTLWLVPLAGFVYDWILTREWTKILLGMVPTIVLLLVVGLVWRGNNLDRQELAQWYSELGDAEMDGLEATLAQATSSDELRANGSSSQTASADQVASSSQNASSNEVEKGEPAPQATQLDLTTQKLSDYAGMLIRRAQMLDPSNRRQFLIAVSMLQQGALAHGRALIRQLAPADSRGYEPAHAIAAMLLAKAPGDPATEPDNEFDQELLHHIELGRNWENAPLQFWIDGSNAYWRLGAQMRRAEYQAESLAMLEHAAAQDPALNLALAHRALALNQNSLKDAALAKAEVHLRQELEQEPRDEQVRIQLAQVFVLKNAFQRAEETLIEGMRQEPNAPLTRTKRALSDLWLRQSIVQVDGQVQVDQQKLEAAWQVDASNPRVVEQIALLARVEGARPSQAMIEALQESLAEGTATVTTHARLSEVYLLRGNYEKALPHLRQVVLQSPQAARYLNNLAYTLAELDPSNLPEALEYSQRAVMAGDASRDPNIADYLDTLGMLYSRAGQSDQAIAALSKAIQLNEQLAALGVGEIRLDFRERIAAEYRKTGDVELAEKFEQKIKELKESQRQAQQKKKQLEAETASRDEAGVMPTATDEMSLVEEPAGTAAVDETKTETEQPDD